MMDKMVAIIFETVSAGGLGRLGLALALGSYCLGSWWTLWVFS